jgi:hypothetical protein
MNSDDVEIFKAGAHGAAQGTVEGILGPYHELVATIFGPSAEEIGRLLRLHTAVFTLEQEAKLFERVKRLVEKTGIKPHRVPFKLLEPIVDNGALEESDELQERWANMLVNAANPDDPDAVAPSFPNVLRELRAADILFLDALYEIFLARGAKPFPFRVNRPVFTSIEFANIMEQSGLSIQGHYASHNEREEYLAAVQTDNRELEFIVDTLQRHRILEQKYDIVPETDAMSTSLSMNLGWTYILSEFGIRFIEACRPPRKRPPGPGTSPAQAIAPKL